MFYCFSIKLKVSPSQFYDYFCNGIMFLQAWKTVCPFHPRGNRNGEWAFLPVFRVERKRKPIEETNDLWTIADHCYAKKTKLKSESEENPELLEEAVKEAQRVRQLQCAELINCMKGSTSIRKHLEAIITGDLVSAWEHRKERPTLYFEDDQLDEAVSFLFGIIRETSRTRRLEDWVDFTINVLLPEVTVHTLAIKYDMPMQEAIVRYKKGIQYEPCELKSVSEELT
ncbi:uncharacterized protein LOC121641692 isoform X2 [Melanotaenia boesemani]|uniref:uncharacterized protein LOC121641692 isoform X2 n=1 Tax=Melanotaenia boesemani TaxID=1250792 RepID=UPI001C04960B|nr:uncharacterized protein LOC121641692 isoform X2 [Melanotaenia boesemani]